MFPGMPFAFYLQRVTAGLCLTRTAGILEDVRDLSHEVRLLCPKIRIDKNDD